MKKSIVLSFFICSIALGAEAGFDFSSNVLLIYERQEFPQTPVPRETVDRYRVRWRPGLFYIPHPDFQLGVEAEVNGIYESDENVQPPRFPEFHTPLFDRDNFRRNKLVLSRAFVTYSPSPSFEAVGGKFDNPFLVTPMVWDREELHPNGGVITMTYISPGETVRLTGRAGDFYATQYYGDRTNVVALQALLQVSAGISRITFSGAYYDHDVKDLAVPLFRTNTRVGGLLLNDYNLMDFVARLRLSFKIPVTGQLNYVKNLAADTFLPEQPGNGDQGYLAEVLVGQLQEQFNFRVGVTFHHVESDAVLAAYNTDDWWFPTRGEGYRIHGSFMAWKQVMFHASYLDQTFIGQENEFKRWQFSAEINWP